MQTSRDDGGQYEEKDMLTMTNPYLALDDSVLFNIEVETTTKGIWKKVEEPL